MSDYSYTYPKEDDGEKMVIFTIGEKQFLMSQKEYDFHIGDGRTNPVLIGETIHMVSNKDFKILKKIEKSI